MNTIFMYCLSILSLLLCFMCTSEAFWPFKHSTETPETSTKQHLSPVVFIPGNGGSQLEAKLNKRSVPNLFCYKVSDWYNLWLTISNLLEPAVQCWVDNIRLRYNPVTRTTMNAEGVEVRVPGWGTTEVIEWIDPEMNYSGAYFSYIVTMLIDSGYTRRKNLHGAPYDFRKGPNELKEYFIDLKKLIESVYESNHQTPVTLFSHSMGSNLALVFLQKQTPEWKTTYIARMISLAGAWAGSMKALKVFAMGDNLDAFILQGSVLKAAEITFPSIAWLMPSPLFWKSSEVLVQTPSRNYTRGNIRKYFEDIGNMVGWNMYIDNLEYVLNFQPPEVELHCIHSNNVPTTERLVYSSDEINKNTPTLIMGDGDGTVNLRSLAACSEWKTAQTQNISIYKVRGVNHLDILNNQLIFDYIKSILFPN